MDNFHETALHSILFKGRSDWYYCYLKSEKIAHVITVLSKSTGADLKEVLQAAVKLPQTILYFVSGELAVENVLAELFSLISMLRLSATRSVVSRENMLVIVGEYESLVERIASGTRPSPFISQNDFDVPMLEGRDVHADVYALADVQEPVNQTPTKETYKGQKTLKDTKKDITDQKDRPALILDVVRKGNGVSIKDISSVVIGCSEKTVQRELVGLIERGLVKKVGERRWSLYFATSQ